MQVCKCTILSSANNSIGMCRLPTCNQSTTSLQVSISHVMCEALMCHTQVPTSLTFVFERVVVDVSMLPLSIMQHWERMDTHGPEGPRGRSYHAATVLCSPLSMQSRTQILIAGGLGERDCWLLDMDQATWRQVSILTLQ